MGRPQSIRIWRETKTCGVCREPKFYWQFAICRSAPDGRSYRCRACSKSYSAERYAADPRKFNLIRLDVRRRAREKALAAYGGRCVCCNEDQSEFLCFDHISGGGNRHRKVIGPDIIGWLARNKYPAGFQVLCWNCNAAKSYSGRCPHELDG